MSAKTHDSPRSSLTLRCTLRYKAWRMVLLLIAGLLVATAIAMWYLPRNSRRVWKFTVRIGAGALICASALPLLGFLFRSAMCGHYEFPAISSRDGRFAAEVNEQDCGAVDLFHSSVNLRQHRQGMFAHIFGHTSSLNHCLHSRS